MPALTGTLAVALESLPSSDDFILFSFLSGGPEFINPMMVADSADTGPLNLPTSCRKDELYFHTMEDEGHKATIHPAIVLSEEQANILAKVKKGDSVFITGPAGL